MPACAANIVYSNSWPNRTAAVPSTTFTVPADGHYRINVGLAVYGAATNQVQVLLTGAVMGYSISASNQQGQANGVFTFVGQSGDAVTWETISGVSSPDSFSLYVTIEQLQ